MVTIDEIRKMGQPPEKVNPAYAHRHYIRTYVWLRKISPYFTKFFIEHGISANHVSSLATFFGTIGSTLFILHNVYLMLVSWIFYLLYALLDCVDGEIARTTKTETVTGLFLEGVGGHIIMFVFFICFGLGLYNLYGNVFFVLCGFGFALAIWIVRSLRGSIELMLMKREGNEKILPPLTERKTFAGKLYRKYLIVNSFFGVWGSTGFLFIPLFEILLPVSYTICGVPLTISAIYFLFYGFDWIARAGYTSIRTYRICLSEVLARDS